MLVCGGCSGELHGCLDQAPRCDDSAPLADTGDGLQVKNSANFHSALWLVAGDSGMVETIPLIARFTGETLIVVNPFTSWAGLL